VLAAANKALWPAVEPALRLPDRQIALAEAWQACTTLREHRGDGHVAALTAAGLSGLEAHLLAAGVHGTPVEVLRDNRGWSPEEWADGSAELARRGLLTADGRATAAGTAAHAAVEARTDVLAEAAFAGLADPELVDLAAALTAAAREVQGSGLLPFPNPMGLPQLAG
jgi:hypothetical protein